MAECDPVFQYALLQQDTGGSYKYYPYGDPAAPTNVKLYPRYSAHRTYHVIDVETMEERVISFAETTLSTPQISRNGGYIVSIISRDAELQLACMDELGMQYAAYGVVPFEFDTFSEISDEEVFVFTYTGNS